MKCGTDRHSKHRTCSAPHERERNINIFLIVVNFLPNIQTPDEYNEFQDEERPNETQPKKYGRIEHPVREVFIMKLYNISNIEKFCSVIDSCEGNVTMLDEKGDKLNLKSKLSQFVALSNVLGAEEKPIAEMEVLVDNPKDTIKLVEFALCA